MDIVTIIKSVKEYQVYGIKGMTSTGEIIDDPRRSFVKAINAGLNRKNRYQAQFKRLYEKLSNDQGEITIDNLRIIGVIVTGDTASMKLLKNKNYIKASTLGIVIDKY